jgi:hypothetical protein
MSHIELAVDRLIVRGESRQVIAWVGFDAPAQLARPVMARLSVRVTLQREDGSSVESLLAAVKARARAWFEAEEEADDGHTQ